MPRRMIDDLDQLRKSDLPTPNEFSIELGKLIRKAREEQKLTQTQLAESLNRSQVTISGIENGKVEVSFLMLLLLAIFLQKPVSYFIPEFVFRSLVVDAKTTQEQEMLRVMDFIGMFGDQQLAVRLITELASYYEERERGEMEPPDF